MAALAYDSLEDLARAVRALPASTVLPARTVLVRSERQAHALRVALVAAPPGVAHPHPLAGTRLVSPLVAAEEVLHAAGVPFTTGESALRPARLARRFRDGRALEHFPRALLAGAPGWDAAFAHAVAALEGAGLAPEDLPRDAPPLRDLAALWSDVDGEAGRSLTAARILADAAAALERDPRLWPHPGAVLVPVDGHEHAALARFLRAIPGATLALRRARPVRERWIASVARRYGEELGALAGGAEVPAAAAPPGTELRRLQALLFHPEPAAAAAALGAAGGPDGTVALEEHAGVEAELDATAAWVAREVLEHGTPLARIGVLVPVQDPLAGLVADRIAGLGLAVHVAGALPASATSAGARALAVLGALRRRLPAEDVAAILPYLALDGPGTARPRPAPGPAERSAPARTHLSHGAALALAYALGTAGGSPARPDGALEWTRRAAERPAELEAALARAAAAGGSDEREAWRLEETLRDLGAVAGALERLVEVARAVLEARPLGALWRLLEPFLRERVLLPGGAPRLLGPLAEALEPALASAHADALGGDDALDAVEAALRSLRIPVGRSGDPAVHVGTLASAAGLAFDAVRIVGLAEGSVPSAPREDPVLPAPLRAALEARTGCAVPSPEDRVLEQLHGFHGAVRAARARLALSAPRVDLARTEREPAAILIEVAAALGRRNARTGEAADPVPGGEALRRDAFAPARAAALAFRGTHPVSEADWLLRAARGAPGLPPSWRGAPHLDLARAAALQRPPAALGPGDGLLAAGEPFPPLPGLDPGRPISASALGDLLACPRRFLMARVLRWEAPAEAPSLRELGPAPFGSLLHRTLERLYRAHGAEIVAGGATLARWVEAGLAVADAALGELLLEVPLLGARIREKERRRLHDAVRAFLEYDFRPGGPARERRRYVDVERGFGTAEAPLALEVAGGPLHVRGYVDRIDATPRTAIVRDVKSGKAHPREGREARPVPERDVQLGLYLKVARTLSEAWGLPARAAGAYAYASGKGEVEERAFASDEDVAALGASTDAWLALARALLAERRFPPTPDEGDCEYCPFAPLCGSEAPRRAAAGLAALGPGDDGTLRAFRALKGDEP